MEKAGALFLDALRCAVRGETLLCSEKPEQQVLRRLFRLAEEHSLLPLVYQGICSDLTLKEHPLVSAYARKARMLSRHQAARTGEFLLVLEQLAARGLHPAVLKGAVCRSLYPQPELRPSTDEDLFILREDYSRYQEALLACGLQVRTPDHSIDEDYEIAYVDPHRDLYLELHYSLFYSEDQAVGDCGRLFDGALSRTVPICIYGQTVYTLAPADHLLYLLCHAYKHLLFGGVGLRQICDICLFAERYGEEIDWSRVRAGCDELGILTLASAFFRIGERHLSIPMPVAFSDLDVDELPLLEDCLSGGVYGVVDPDRQHSSRFTLEAVAAGKKGRSGRGIWKSLFPGKAYLKSNYPYARQHPVLIPVAWVQRLWKYLRRGNRNAARSLSIGRERVELLRQYKIIP